MCKGVRSRGHGAGGGFRSAAGVNSVNLVRGDHPHFQKRKAIIWAETLASNQWSRSENCSENGFLKGLGRSEVSRVALRMPRNSQSCSKNSLFTPSFFFLSLGWFPGF